MNRFIVTALFVGFLVAVGSLFFRASPRVAAQSPTQAATSQGTAFTYQGQLRDNSGNPLSGAYDFQFTLHDAATGGNQVGSVTLNNVSVTNGSFSVQLDFGSSAFDGNARWLEIAVRPAGSGSYTTLTPRQALTATPYALYSLKAPWGGLTGVPSGFADGVDNDTLSTLSCSSSGQVAEWNGSQWVCGTDDTGGGGSFWSLTGNAGTNSSTDFLGTTDNVTLTLAVSSTTALRLEPTAGTPNLIGGYSGNSVASGVVGATIAGGGGSGVVNQVTADYAVVGGGKNNTASGTAATVGGGVGNIASDYYTTISGGWSNIAGDTSATVGGGSCNRAGNLTQATCAHTPDTGRWSTVSGGINNLAKGYASTVGGGVKNTTPGDQSTVGGGLANDATGIRSTIGGGWENTTSGYAATVSGGFNNVVQGNYATVGGGFDNIANGAGAFVGGGGYNGTTSSGNQALATASTIAGGYNNVITPTASYAVVSGGQNNTAVSIGATVSGGQNNTAQLNATVGGGSNNKAGGVFATVGGGSSNNALAFATIGGGDGNTASGSRATVGGGGSNTASDWYTTVGGGYSNDASGYAATVPGGYDNTAAGDYSFAAGRRAKANHNGTFVWGDSTNADINSPAADTFIVRANGGIWFGKGTTDITPTIGSGVFINTSTGAHLTTGGVWTNASDRNAKGDFQPVDPQAVLEKVAQLPITTWSYKAEGSAVRHMGPTAQDFYAAFGLGNSDTSITTVDADGVALAAIQGLYRQNQEQAKRIAELEAQNRRQQAQIAALEARLDALERGRGWVRLPDVAPWLGLGLLAGLVLARRRKEVGR